MSNMETKIIRHDTGLDFKRIEHIIGLFHNKVRTKRGEGTRKQQEVLQQRKLEAFVHFGLVEAQQAISEINGQIEGLKKQKQQHEERIRDFTQGTDKRYNTYDSIHEDSLMHHFIYDDQAKLQSAQERKLTELCSGIEEEMWLAKDIGQAVDIYQKYCAALEHDSAQNCVQKE